MRRLVISLVAGAAGVACTLAGLGIDAWLHGQDPTVAQREGIFTLSNPGHALLAAGIALLCGGIFSALHAAWGMVRAPGLLGRAWTRHVSLAASAVASVAAIGFALSASAAGHDHADGMAAGHAHEPASAAVEAPPATSPTHTAADLSHQVATQPAPEQTAALVTEPTHTHAAITGAAPADNTGSMDTAPMAAAHTHPADMDGEMGAMPLGAMPSAARHHPQPTAEEITCLTDLTAQAKEATARFADYNVAVAEGYVPPAKVDGTHYGNQQYRRDGVTFDLANPETLVYKTNDDGSRLLVGALYQAFKGQGPTPCGNATYWHTHLHCEAADGTRVPEIDEREGACPAGSTAVEGKIEMLHLWFLPRRTLFQ
jgi:hypothetical protein